MILEKPNNMVHTSTHLYLKREVVDVKRLNSQMANKGLNTEDAVLLIRKSEIANRFNLLQELLPSCQHHFAVKSCPQNNMIEEWNNLGGHFDVASTGEIELLENFNIDLSNCIYTHPIKKEREIAFAINRGIRIFVVENYDELNKFMPYQNDVQLMLRLSFSSEDAGIDLSSKFGLMPEHAISFVTNATDAGFKIAGLCFHVGSQMKSNSQYIKALSVCKNIYSELENIGICLSILDIGGGFPFHASETAESLHHFFDPINNFIENNFRNVKCLSEPGRFVSAPIATLICKVVGKSKRTNCHNYYLNEGIYGCLSNKIFDFYDFNQMHTYPSKPNDNYIFHNSNLFGPTCDSIDKLLENHPLPELSISDTVIFENMGAYTFASTTNFNMLGRINTLAID